MTRDEIAREMAPKPKPPIKKRFHYKEAFIMSPKLARRIVQVERISDGIAIIEALGEGKIMVSTARRDPSKGYFDMAECTVEELRGKSEAEIFEMLDRRTDQLQRTSRRK
jgi:hypothetical protein